MTTSSVQTLKYANKIKFSKKDKITFDINKNKDMTFKVHTKG